MKNLNYICLGLALALCISVFCQEENRHMDKFDDVLKAIEELRHKTIPQAYFLLHSQHMPPSPIFAPDTHGAVYVIICRWEEIKDASNEQMDQMTKEFNKGWKKLGLYPKVRPIIDKIKMKVIYYPDSDWKKLKNTTKAWSVPEKEIENLFETNLLVSKEFLVLKIPQGKEKEFLTSFIKEGHGIDPIIFTCSIGWN